MDEYTKIKPWHEQPERQVKFRFDERVFSFFITPGGVLVDWLYAIDGEGGENIFRLPEFASALAGAMIASDITFSPSLDEHGIYAKWRADNPRFAFRLHPKSRYNVYLKELVADDKSLCLEILSTDWDSKKETPEFINYLPATEVDELRKSVESKLTREYKAQFKQLEQQSQQLKAERQSIKDERAAFEEEKRLWRQMQDVLSDASNVDAGYIYLLRGGGSRFKIGKTIDPAKRLSQFQISSPDIAQFEVVIATGRMSELESNLHAQFKDKRIRGEWFMLFDEDVNFIKSLA